MQEVQKRVRKKKPARALTPVEQEIRKLLRESEVRALIKLFRKSKQRSYVTAAVLLLAVLEKAIEREKAPKK